MVVGSTTGPSTESPQTPGAWIPLVLVRMHEGRTDGTAIQPPIHDLCTRPLRLLITRTRVWQDNSGVGVFPDRKRSGRFTERDNRSIVERSLTDSVLEIYFLLVERLLALIATFTNGKHHWVGGPSEPVVA